MCSASSEKRSTLKGKNLLPLGANSFLLEKTLFRRDLMSRGTNRMSQKLPPLFRNDRISTRAAFSSVKC